MGLNFLYNDKKKIKLSKNNFEKKKFFTIKIFIVTGKKKLFCKNFSDGKKKLNIDFEKFLILNIEINKKRFLFETKNFNHKFINKLKLIFFLNKIFLIK